MGDPALQLACIQAYNDFLVDFGAEHRAVHPGRRAAVLGPRRDPGRDRALRRHRPQGHRVHPGPRRTSACPKLTDRYWDPMWRSAEEKGLPVNFHIASGDLDPFRRRPPRQRPARQLRGDGRVVLHGQRPDDRPARSPAASATASPTSNFVSVESGIGWIPFALDALDWQWKNCGVADRAPRVRPAAERVLPAPDLRLLLVRAGHGAHGDRAARRRQHAVRDRLPPPDEHVARARRASAERPDDYIASDVRRPAAETTLRKILHDNAARIYHLD